MTNQPPIEQKTGFKIPEWAPLVTGLILSGATQILPVNAAAVESFPGPGANQTQGQVLTQLKQKSIEQRMNQEVAINPGAWPVTTNFVPMNNPSGRSDTNPTMQVINSSVFNGADIDRVFSRFTLPQISIDGANPQANKHVFFNLNEFYSNNQTSPSLQDIAACENKGGEVKRLLITSGLYTNSGILGGLTITKDGARNYYPHVLAFPKETVTAQRPSVTVVVYCTQQ